MALKNTELVKGFKFFDNFLRINLFFLIKIKKNYRQAKQQKLRLWKNYNQSNTNSDESNRNLSGKIVEVLNGDGLIIKLNDGSFKKIFLSSIRPPR